MSFFKEKRVFITGASSGIGEGLALHLGNLGAVVGLSARSSEKLESIVGSIRNAGGSASAYPSDVTDRQSITRAIESMVEEHGEIDIVIANAGIGGAHDIRKGLGLGSLQKTFDVNFFGAVNTVDAVLKSMIKRDQGQIVLISSLAGMRGLPSSGAYSASKAALNNFFESLRLDLLNTGVDVTIIQPGFIKTPLTSGRENQMPFLMELEDSIPLFLRAIEKRKRFSAFPWQLASIVRLGLAFPGALYDRIAGGRNYRE